MEHSGGRVERSTRGADLVVLNARIWAAPEMAIAAPSTLVVRNGVIVSTDAGDEVPVDLPRFDAEGRVVTAGFWNCHVHFTERVWTGARRGNAAELQCHLDDMLLSRGFTTVLDLSSDPRTTLALARRIDSGELRGPRIVTAATGIRPWRGIPFYVRESVPWFLRWLLPGPATSWGAAVTVAFQARQGAGLTKLFTGSYVTPTRVKPMRLAVARAAVRAAHQRGMLVLAHPSNHVGTRVAVEAGVDALAHVPDETEGTEELLRFAADRGIRVVPTLSMFATTVTTDEAYLAPIRAALRGFVGAGGRVLFGTDVGYMAERATNGEFRALAASGLTAADILRTLTTEPAMFLRDEHAGTVDVGKRADLTILNTTSDAAGPEDFADIRAVIRGGRVAYGDGDGGDGRRAQFDSSPT
jgi:imidazolonepropionase-like amidohydrolase